MIPRHLVDVFRRGSRTYFYSSLFFDGPARRDVFALYAFVRTADDFVDRVPQDRAGFGRFVARYHASARGQPSGDAVIDGFVELATRKGFDPAWTECFLDAMRQDLTRRDYATLAELEAYMYGSAEVIGLFMARLLDLPTAAEPAARRLGKAMQYVNFLRDVAEDRALQRTYVPRAVLAQHGLDALDHATVVAAPVRFAAMMRSEIDRYRSWQAEAEAGYRFLPERARVCIQTAADMYLWTADVIARRPLLVFERHVKPSPARVLARLARNTAAAVIRSSRARLAAALLPASWE